MTLALVWLAAMVILVVVETMTLEFTCLALAIGCLLGAGSAAMGWPIALQLVVVAVGSGFGLVLIAPLLRRRLTPPDTLTGSAAIVGSHAVVTEAIAPPTQGKVKLNGVTWQAASSAAIPAGTPVIVSEMSGALLEVVPAHDLAARPQSHTAPEPEASPPIRPHPQQENA